MALNWRKYRRAFKPNGARIFLAGDASERLEDQTFPHDSAVVATAFPNEVTLRAVEQLVLRTRRRLNARRQQLLRHPPFERRRLRLRFTGHESGDGGVGGGGSGVGSSGVGDSGGVCGSVHLRVQKQRRQQR